MVGPFQWEGSRLLVLDQTALPEREVWLETPDVPSMAQAIARLAVRGAPALGIAAALSLAQEAARVAEDAAGRLKRIEQAGALLQATRPTAVNLAWAIARMRVAARAALGEPPAAWIEALRGEARRIWEEDLEASRSMAVHGAGLFPEGRRFLTHCNTGALATGGGGTALGVLLALHRPPRRSLEVYVTETRPLLQGARLTAWELHRAGVPVRLLADGAAASLLLRGGVDGVLVGADRIARNGDVANKVGTLPLALAAREGGVPFVVVAPTWTVDGALPDGGAIPIEERSPLEVTTFRGVPVAPEGVGALNPAFDVTPARLVSAIVTERGVERPPFTGLGGVGGVDTSA